MTLKLTSRTSSLHIYLSNYFELFKHHFAPTKQATFGVLLRHIIDDTVVYPNANPLSEAHLLLLSL
jgi:hypothetical protein